MAFILKRWVLKLHEPVHRRLALQAICFSLVLSLSRYGNGELIPRSWAPILQGQKSSFVPYGLQQRSGGLAFMLSASFNTLAIVNHSGRLLFTSIFIFNRSSTSQLVTLQVDSKPMSVLCHMGDFGCGDGGWTPVMKINGNKVHLTGLNYYSTSAHWIWHGS